MTPTEPGYYWAKLKIDDKRWSVAIVSGEAPFFTLTILGVNLMNKTIFPTDYEFGPKIEEPEK